MDHNQTPPPPIDPSDPDTRPVPAQNPSSPPQPTGPIDPNTALASAPAAMLLQQVRSIRRVLLLAGVAVLVLLLLGGLWAYLWH
jgi:hypothetical protein